MESWLFLGLILVVGIVSKNQSIIIATIFVMILKFLPFTDNIMTEFRKKGINWGVLGQPEITVALVFGTIIGVVFMKGVAAGPVIASGITYCILQIINIIWKK